MYEITISRRLGHILDNSTSLYAVLRVFQSFDILATALVALRDPRKICSTNNLRPAKKVSAWRKTPLETTTYGNQKYHTFRVHMDDSMPFYVVFLCFSALGVLARKDKALWDLKIDFSTSNLRLVRKSCSSKWHTSRNYNIWKSTISHISWQIFTILGILCCNFMFFQLCVF